MEGCGKNQNNKLENQTFLIYYLNLEETKIVSRETKIISTETLNQIAEVVKILQEQTDSTQIHSVLTDTVVLLSCNYDAGKLYLNFDDGYKTLSNTTEVLTRAALVRTFCQIEGVDSIVIQIDGEGLVDHDGKAVGSMVAEQFIDNDGKEINTYEKAELTLYFANEDGNKLVKVEREVSYNSNISLQKLVIEQLIEGPNLENVYPIISSSTKVISVTVTDGTCYVNLDSELLTQVGNVTAEVTVYSIVNSLTILPDVDRVQISVDGSSDILLREMINLNAVFERNRDLIE